MSEFIQVNDEYIPGVCNIGPSELARRKVAMYASIVGLIASTIILYLLEWNQVWYLVLFIPAVGFGVAFLQVYYKFCVAYGMKAIFNFDNLGSAEKVVDDESRQKDLRKVRLMYVQSIVFGVIYSLAMYFLL